MWQHRPFTRGGRHLRVVRPRPFVPPPLAVQFWQLLTGPAAGVGLVLRSAPSAPALSWAVGLAGLGGGALHALVLARAGGPSALLPADLAAHVLGAALAWLSAAVLLHLACLALAGSGPFAHALRICGVALTAFPAAALLQAMAGRTDRLVVTAAGAALLAWLGTIAYQTARQAYGLPHRRAAAAALLPVMAGAALCLSWTGVFFPHPLVPADWLPPHWLAGSGR